jgi:hypothetical protein
VTGRRAEGTTRIEVELSATPGWRLPAPVAVDVVADDSQNVSLRGLGIIESGAGHVSVIGPASVRSGVAHFDPDVDVFRRLQTREIPATLARVLGRPADLVIVGTGRGEKTSQASRAGGDALQKTQESPRAVRLDTEVTRKELDAARVVWVLGRPAPDTTVGQAVRSHLPSRSEFGDDQIRISGKEASGDGAAGCIVMDFPDVGQGAMALLDALSPEAMTSLVRRVSHYGKYSWLLFSGDRPIVRDVAPPPLTLSATFGGLP